MPSEESAVEREEVATPIRQTRHTITDEDVDAVIGALKSGWLTGGPAVAELEAAFAARVEARHAVAFSSGTAGLHAAAAVAGLGPGDRVLVPSLTFVATANLARYVGADVVFGDVGAGTWSLDVASVPDGIDAAVVVHYAGFPVGLGAMTRRPRVVIEDAAHALGSVGPDGPIGNCARSDLCVFSLHPTKTITGAEGGLVTTNDDALAAALRLFRNHGLDHARSADAWGYAIDSLGFNYRLSDLHAALANSQLSRVDELVERRNHLASRYDRLLADLDVVTPPPTPPGLTHARHLYPVLVEDRPGVHGALGEAGVGVQVHYQALHRMGAFSAHAGDPLPVTDRLADRILSLPLHPLLSEGEQDRVVVALASATGAGRAASTGRQ